MKVYISPSSQVHNMYTGMAGVSEAAVCNEIGKQLYNIIGGSFETALADKGSNVAGRIAASNHFGADLHICIHTNAAAESVTGTLVMCHKSNISDPVVNAVYRNVASLTPSTSDQGVKAADQLAEIRSTKAKCIYIEVDYHSNTSMAKWLAEHTEQIALSIAAGLMEGTGISIPQVIASMRGDGMGWNDMDSNDQNGADMPEIEEERYYVVAGSYLNKENADRKSNALNRDGIESWVKKGNIG